MIAIICQSPNSNAVIFTTTYQRGKDHFREARDIMANLKINFTFKLHDLSFRLTDFNSTLKIITHTEKLRGLKATNMFFEERPICGG